jgi:heptosyltransferase-1
MDTDRIAVKSMNQDGNQEESRSKHVLLVRLGSMGDVLHGLPTLATLKQNFPAWKIDWLVEWRWSELLHGNPYLARVIEFDTLSWRRDPFSTATLKEFREAVSHLREESYDYAVDLQGAVKSAVACRLSGAAQVIGLDRPWLREPVASVLYSRRVPCNAAHIVEANLALAAALGARQAAIEFPLPSGDDNALPLELRADELAVINPGAGWAAKRWPTSSYAQVCDDLDEHFGIPVIINCGPGESTPAEEVRAKCRRAQPRIFSGSVAGLIALLRRARLMIGPDTGPLHLAAALGVPTVAMYGPTDPRRNGPYGNAHRTLRSEHAVTSHRRSRKPSGQMEQIRPSHVMEAARELLDYRNAASANSGARRVAASAARQL